MAAPAARHTPPTSDRPDLRDARSGHGVVRVRMAGLDSNSEHVEEFAVGLARAEAVTALLVRSHLHGEAVLDPALGAETEWVVTMPTRRWYTANPSLAAPFRLWTAFDGALCHQVTYTLIDRRNTRFEPVSRVNIGGVGWRIDPTLCSATSVASERRPGPSGATSLLGARTGLTGIELGREYRCCFSGTPAMPRPIEDYERFRTGGVALIPLRTGGAEWHLPSGRRVMGLPAIGLALTRYVNANAQPGLLANYGMALPMASEGSRWSPAE